MILALDISTSITGVTVLDCEGKVLLNDAWNFKRCKTFYEKLVLAEEKLALLELDYGIKDIYIEESLQAFRPGFSSAKTILTLAKFNGTMSWMIYKIFGIEPKYIGASTARKKCGIKIPKGQKAKQVVMQYMLDKEPWFVVEYTHKGNPRPHFYDMADSYIIAKAGYLCQKAES